MSSKILTFTLNGETIRVVVEPTDMLADVLRDKLNLIGVKKRLRSGGVRGMYSDYERGCRYLLHHSCSESGGGCCGNH
jgi:hypothetical protein